MKPSPRPLVSFGAVVFACAALGCSSGEDPVFTDASGAGGAGSAVTGGGLAGTGGAVGDGGGGSRPDLPFDPEPGDGFGLCEVSLDCAQEIPDEPKVPCHLTERRGGVVEYDGPAGLELRGRSSLGFPKHQYSVELRDDTGAGVDANLAGMGAESDWVLNGAYIDRALVRNKLGFELFQGFGGKDRYAAQSIYCTMTLNGTWLGVYFLAESIKRSDDRVDIASDATDTGKSFIVKLDDGGGVFDNSSIGYGVWKMVYPKQATASPAAVAGVGSWIAGWQAAVAGPTPADPDHGIFAYVDMGSAIDFVLIEELMKNNDAYFLSVHLWKDVDGKMFFAPWDLDLTLGQPIYNNNVPPEAWIAYRPAMIARMLDVPGFREALAARWQELRTGVLRNDAVLARLEGYRKLMGDVAYQNFQVWPIESIQFAGDQLPVVHSYDEEYQRVLAWLPARLAWMDQNIAGY